MEYTEIKMELTQMDVRLTDMEQKINSIDTKLTQVVDAILGNPLTKTGGFVQDIRNLENKIDELERKQEIKIVELEAKQKDFDNFKKRTIWTVSIIISAALIVQYFINLYINMKK
jgi:hypothetical protein